MRFTDGPRTHGDVLVRAGAERVWELVTDIRLPARLSPELRRVAWLDGADRPAVGARFEGHNRHRLLGEWRTVSQVTELVPRQTFTWAVMDADGRYGPPALDPARPMAVWSYTLRTEAGGVRLRQSVRVGPGPSGVTRAIGQRPDREPDIIAFRLAELREGIRETLAGVKALAEAETGRDGQAGPWGSDSSGEQDAGRR
ncbi:SRPBCC family protein [Streptomyces sp. NPDC090994]|uniref:SRPBCC family protein n=1 Tax=Streptomyces sp. NPDC090994 TaxID=3365969 RepID=UPI0037F8CCC9